MKSDLCLVVVDSDHIVEQSSDYLAFPFEWLNIILYKGSIQFTVELVILCPYVLAIGNLYPCDLKTELFHLLLRCWLIVFFTPIHQLSQGELVKCGGEER